MTHGPFELQFSVTQDSDCDARLVSVANFCAAGLGGSDCAVRLVLEAIFFDATLGLRCTARLSDDFL